MEDEAIISLYYRRDESAIAATEKKYGGYCRAVASHILTAPEDVQECLNDTWLAAWNSIPPNMPADLSAYLVKITRNLAFKCYRMHQARKRGGGELPLVFEELGDVVSGRENVEEALNRKLLLEAMEAFLEELPSRKRAIFLSRYWYAMEVKEIAKRYATTANHISVTLNRLRKELRRYLEERGFNL